MLITADKQKTSHETVAPKISWEDLDLYPLPNLQSIRSTESYKHDPKFDLKVGEPKPYATSSADLLQRRVKYLEIALSVQRLKAERRAESLETDLEMYKRRADLFRQLLRRASAEDEHAKAEINAALSNISKIRNEIASKISEKDIVRAVRESRDER